MMSLVSLGNCKSEVYVDRMSELEKKRKRKMLYTSDEIPVTIIKDEHARSNLLG